MNDKRKVVVTGLGPITPIGIGKEEFWQALEKGKSGVTRIDEIVNVEGIEVKIGAPVKEFNIEDYGTPKMTLKRAAKLGRASQMALGAVKLALEDSRLKLGLEDPGRIGVIMGTGIGNLDALIRNYDCLSAKGPRGVKAWFIPQFMPNALSGEIAIEFGFKGPNETITTACAASTHAIGAAAKIIKDGEADIVVTGGSEAIVRERIAIAGFAKMGALSKRNEEPEKASRPFDAQRDGFVMGEGAGILILETLEHARERRAHIYAQVSGFAMNDDASHITAPSKEGEAEVMLLALKRAGFSPWHIDLINAHAPGTRLGDEAESFAIQEVFGDGPMIQATKSMIGHLLGAAGAVEVIAAILAIEKGIVHPTLNLEEPDPDIGLAHVCQEAERAKVKTILSNSFGFGGHNGCLLLSQME